MIICQHLQKYIVVFLPLVIKYYILYRSRRQVFENIFYVF